MAIKPLKHPRCRAFGCEGLNTKALSVMNLHKEGLCMGQYHVLHHFLQRFNVSTVGVGRASQPHGEAAVPPQDKMSSKATSDKDLNNSVLVDTILGIELGMVEAPQFYKTYETRNIDDVLDLGWVGDVIFYTVSITTNITTNCLTYRELPLL